MTDMIYQVMNIVLTVTMPVITWNVIDVAKRLRSLETRLTVLEVLMERRKQGER